MKICSLPFLSSKRNSFALLAPPPLLLRVTTPEIVLWSGKAYLGTLTPLYTDPTTNGLSGSPFRNATTTSSFRRGQKNVPHPFPAHCCATRTQVLSGLFCFTLSHMNWMFMRPYLSIQISSPVDTTTMAVCGP